MENDTSHLADCTGYQLKFRRKHTEILLVIFQRKRFTENLLEIGKRRRAQDAAGRWGGAGDRQRAHAAAGIHPRKNRPPRLRPAAQAAAGTPPDYPACVRVHGLPLQLPLQERIFAILSCFESCP